MKVKNYQLALLALISVSAAFNIHAQEKTKKAETKKESSAKGSKFDSFAAKIKKAQIGGSGAINLKKIIPDLFTAVPGPIVAGFKNAFSMTSLNFKENRKIPAVSDINETKKIAGRAMFTGVLTMGDLRLSAKVRVYEDDYKNNLYSLTITMPKDYKISKLMPKLKPIDVLPLPQFELVFSDFDHLRTDGVVIQKGVSIVSKVDMKGPFKLLGELKNKAKELKSIVLESERPVHLVGRVPANMTSANFKIVMPFRFGVDFQKIQDIPKEFSDFLKKITTDDIVIKAEIKGNELNLFAQNGVQITFADHKPIKFQGFGEVDLLSGKFSLGGKMPTMIELVYLSIGNLGVEIIVDPSVEVVLALLGIPFSGIGLRGRIDVGTKGDRASLEVWTKISLEVKKAINVVFKVLGKNLNFTNLVYLLTQMATKAKIAGKIPKDSIPVISLDKVVGRFAPWETTVAAKKIDPGFALKTDATIFGQKFGLHVDIDHVNMIMKGKGWMPPINFKIGDYEVFSFTGAGKDMKYGTKDDSPYAHLMFDAKKPLKTSFALTGLLKVPALALKSKTDIIFARGRYECDIETEALGFGVDFEVKIDPVKWKEIGISYKFKNDFDKFINEKAVPELEKLKEKAVKEVAKIDEQIGELSREIKEGGKEGAKATDEEIKETKATIARIEDKIAALKKECDQATGAEKIGVCAKVAAEITAQGTALASQKTYLEGLLKPGKEVVKGGSKAAAAITKELADAKVAQKSAKAALDTVTTFLKAIAAASSVFKLKEASGAITAKDIGEGKLPLLKTFIIEVNIPKQKKVTVSVKDLEFNFKDPIDSLGTILQKVIIPEVKIG